MQHTIAVDLSKTVFQVAESERPGIVSRNRRLTRRQFERYVGRCPRSRFLFEACGSAHFWGRQLRAGGHEVKLLPPHRVRGYRTGDKTDRTDAKALLEADRNQEILEVPVKSADQQCLASLHRLRSGYVTARTARLNAIRGLLREYGISIPVGAHRVAPVVLELMDEVPAPLRSSLMDAVDEVKILERRIQGIEGQLKGLIQQTPVAQHLLTIPGIGIVTASALAGMVGDFHRFPSGRHLAAYLGLVPREHSSGPRRRLGGISKRGDTYLRTLLIHGARVVLRWANHKESLSALEEWALQIQHRRGHNLATVAVANKMARLAWVLATENRGFRP
jgi:transposase